MMVLHLHQIDHTESTTLNRPHWIDRVGSAFEVLMLSCLLNNVFG